MPMPKKMLRRLPSPMRACPGGGLGFGVWGLGLGAWGLGLGAWGLGV